MWEAGKEKRVKKGCKTGGGGGLVSRCSLLLDLTRGALVKTHQYLTILQLTLWWKCGRNGDLERIRGLLL